MFIDDAGHAKADPPSTEVDYVIECAHPMIVDGDLAKTGRDAIASWPRNLQNAVVNGIDPITAKVENLDHIAFDSGLEIVVELLFECEARMILPFVVHVGEKTVFPSLHSVDARGGERIMEI